MLPEMFVNELSLVPAPDVVTAQTWARNLILTIRATVARGLPRLLRMPEDFYTRQLGPAYYWRDFLNDKRVDLESRRYFRSLATKIPFLRDLESMDASYVEIDCYWNSQIALGLKAAHVADGLALSMATQQAWDCATIVCEIHEIVDEDLSRRKETVQHASSTKHVASHADWIHTRMQTSVVTGEHLWQQREKFFPMLNWCPGVEDQMSHLPIVSLASIVRGLFHLNAFCLVWQQGAYDPGRIECAVSPESESTLSRYWAERRFLCPDGEQRVFNWHAKVGQWRIHFDPSVGPGNLLIGYAGKHLRTTKFK